MPLTHYRIKKCNVRSGRWYVVCAVHGHRSTNWIIEETIFGSFHPFGEPIVYTPTKFCENILIGGRAMPPSFRYVLRMVPGHRLPNWIFVENAVWLSHTLREFITYIPTKFRENNLIGGRHIPIKRNSKPALATEFYFRFQILTNAILRGPSSVSLYKISRKSFTARLSYCNSTFLYTGLPLNLHCQRHNDTVPSCRPYLPKNRTARNYSPRKRSLKIHQFDANGFEC